MHPWGIMKTYNTKCVASKRITLVTHPTKKEVERSHNALKQFQQKTDRKRKHETQSKHSEMHVSMIELEYT